MGAWQRKVGKTPRKPTHFLFCVTKWQQRNINKACCICASFWAHINPILSLKVRILLLCIKRPPPISTALYILGATTTNEVIQKINRILCVCESSQSQWYNVTNDFTICWGRTNSTWYHIRILWRTDKSSGEFNKVKFCLRRLYIHSDCACCCRCAWNFCYIWNPTIMAFTFKNLETYLNYSKHWYYIVHTYFCVCT